MFKAIGSIIVKVATSIQTWYNDLEGGFPECYPAECYDCDDSKCDGCEIWERWRQ